MSARVVRAHSFYNAHLFNSPGHSHPDALVELVGLRSRRSYTHKRGALPCSACHQRVICDAILRVGPLHMRFRRPFVSASHRMGSHQMRFPECWYYWRTAPIRVQTVSPVAGRWREMYDATNGDPAFFCVSWSSMPSRRPASGRALRARKARPTRPSQRTPYAPYRQSRCGTPNWKTRWQRWERLACGPLPLNNSPSNISASRLSTVPHARLSANNRTHSLPQASQNARRSTASPVLWLVCDRWRDWPVGL